MTCQLTTLISLDTSSWYWLYLTNGSYLRRIVVQESECLRSCLLQLSSMAKIQDQFVQVCWPFGKNAVPWGKHFVNRYLVANRTELRSFQIKLNMRAIVNDIPLHGFENKDSDKCIFCNFYREILPHLYCACIVVVF